MSRTKQEVRDFLDSQVGLSVNAKTGSLQGQCVSLIKALMEFLGVPDPYKSRGNAKDAGDTYLREGIAAEGPGWLTVVVNRSMGNGYGHIWVDLKDEANYEQNGKQALKVTKDTRPWNQGQQYINLDKWIGDSMAKLTKIGWQELAHGILGRNGLSERTNALDGSSDNSDYIGRELNQALLDELFNSAEARKWRDSKEYGSVPEINTRLKSIPTLTKERDEARAEVDRLKKELAQSGGQFTKVVSTGTDLYIKK